MSYLPVSAMPTTSWPAKIAGHEQAWIGVGAANPSHAALRPAGASSWSKDKMGISGVVPWIVTELSARNLSISVLDGGEEVVREDEAVFSGSTPRDLCFFLFSSSGAGDASMDFELSPDDFDFFLSFLYFFLDSSIIVHVLISNTTET